MKQKFLAIFLIMAMLLSLTACGQSDSSPAAPSASSENQTISDTQQTQEKPTIVFVSKGPDDFWAYVEAGVAEAAEKYGINTYTILPDKAYQADRQVVAMDDVINTAPDGIVFAPLDTDACVLPAKTAMDAGIPVTLVDTLIASEDYISAFMTDNRAAGAKAADHMAEVLGDKGGVIALFSGSATSPSDFDRIQGFIEQCEEKYPKLICLEPMYNNGGDAAQTASQATDILQAHPEVAGIYCINNWTTTAIANVMIQMERTDIVLGGFDSDADEIALMKEGLISYLMVQQPYQMGYMAMEACYKALQGENVSHEALDTGCAIITQENMDTEESQKLLNPLA